MKCCTVLLAIYSLLLPLVTGGNDDVYPEDIDYNFCKCNCDDLIPFEIKDPPFISSSNCVRIKANGDRANPGGYWFILDTFAHDHTVFHDLWFKKNKKQQRFLSGGFWRIYYPWINASHTSDNVPFVIQNILTREYVTSSTTYELQIFRWVYAAFKLTERALWKTEMKRDTEHQRWTFQNHKTNEYLIQHQSAVGEHWWEGRIFAHDKKFWDKYREGNMFWVHPCF